jgi:hypothetical protein
VFIAYCVIAVLYGGMLVFSGILKLRQDPVAVQMLHGLLGVPLGAFPLLAACEIAGAVGLVAGIRWERLGIAASIGLVAYFVGAILTHLRVGDFAGMWSPALMLAISLTALITRIRSGARAWRTA